MLLGLALWLDLRGKPCASDLDTLLGLYGGVRKQFDKAGLPPPQGSAVSGVVHDASDLDGKEEDGELSLLVLAPDNRLIDADGEQAGRFVVASSGPQPSLNAAAHEAIRRPEANLVLLSGRRSDSSVLPLFDFSLAQAQHCRRISGAETALIAEVRDAAGLRALQRAERDDDAAVPMGALLKPEAGLWFAALKG